MSHPPTRAGLRGPGPFCRFCRAHWVFTGQIPHRGLSGRRTTVVLVGLFATAVASLWHHRDLGAVLAAMVCVASAVVVLRDRTHRCSGCTALRVAAVNAPPAPTSLPCEELSAGALPRQRQGRA